LGTLRRKKIKEEGRQAERERTIKTGEKEKGLY
jgi:hypothetical protein